jgi:hypothetical protein
MKYDIEAYNRASVASETAMLLYNIGELSKHQPPHFMMLASVSQSRSFSGNAGFQWSQVFNTLSPITTIISKTIGVTTTTTTVSNSHVVEGGNWQAGPFTAASTENPTITFVPIQGQEFANRFESPLRDKLTLLLEDGRWYNTPADATALMVLTAQSLYLKHGADDDSDSCRHPDRKEDPKDSTAWYVNRRRESWPSPEALHFGRGPEALHYRYIPDYFHDDFAACIFEIVNVRRLHFVSIDGHHPVPTKASADPLAADVVSALGANYEWTSKGKDFELTTPIRIPAWLDYAPDFHAQKAPRPDLAPLMLHKRDLKPIDLVYGTPKDYTWTKDPQGGFALVPNGYGLNKVGQLAELGTCEVGACKPGTTCESGKCETGECEAGQCEPGECELNRCEPAECYSGKCNSDKTRLLYSDKIIDYVSPVWPDYFYVELRRNDPDPHHHNTVIYNNDAEQACFGSREKKPRSNLVCGFLKIGNLLQIMQRLADMACKGSDLASGHCERGAIFAIGRNVSAWADRSMQIGPSEYIWEPAHNPQTNRPLAELDRTMFSDLYELYQMSLVDTSRLVTGAPPITISK